MQATEQHSACIFDSPAVCAVFPAHAALSAQCIEPGNSFLSAIGEPAVAGFARRLPQRKPGFHHGALPPAGSSEVMTTASAPPTRCCVMASGKL